MRSGSGSGAVTGARRMADSSSNGSISSSLAVPSLLSLLPGHRIASHAAAGATDLTHLPAPLLLPLQSASVAPLADACSLTLHESKEKSDVAYDTRMSTQLTSTRTHLRPSTTSLGMHRSFHPSLSPLGRESDSFSSWTSR